MKSLVQTLFKHSVTLDAKHTGSFFFMVSYADGILGHQEVSLQDEYSLIVSYLFLYRLILYDPTRNNGVVCYFRSKRKRKCVS